MFSPEESVPAGLRGGSQHYLFVGPEEPPRLPAPSSTQAVVGRRGEAARVNTDTTSYKANTSSHRSTNTPEGEERRGCQQEQQSEERG